MSPMERTAVKTGTGNGNANANGVVLHGALGLVETLGLAAGVAILLAQAAGRGALLNVAINLEELPEGPERDEITEAAEALKLAFERADSRLKSLQSELA